MPVLQATDNLDLDRDGKTQSISKHLSILSNSGPVNGNKDFAKDSLCGRVS